MLLLKIVLLTKEIEKLRAELTEIAGNKGLRDEQVLKVSQHLDREIVVLQRILLNKAADFPVARFSRSQ